jgi:hypothetical protein
MGNALNIFFTAFSVFVGARTEATASTPAADRSAESRLIIRTYDTTSLSPAARTSALATATQILQVAGLDVAWRPCESIPAEANTCPAPLGAGELAIRFLLFRPPARTGNANRVQLGYSIVDRHAHAGSLATIYVDSVAKLARDAGTHADVLLGRAIAHEIGHLLLGTTSHGRKGLMRAIWSAEALQRDQTDDWLFTASDAGGLRRSMRLAAAGSRQ